MLMMGYFRAPKLGGRKSSSPERDGQSLRAALLLDGESTGTVPKGYFAVYVGAEARRFVVPMSLLCQPAFRALMERAAEEFGFGQAGGLRIPCCEEDFVATVAALLPDESRQRRRSAAGGRRSASVNW
jgi:SAUR family protein